MYITKHYRFPDAYSGRDGGGGERGQCNTFRIRENTPHPQKFEDKKVMENWKN